MKKKLEKKLEETKEEEVKAEEVIEKKAKISPLDLVFSREDLNELKDKVNEIVSFLSK